MKLDLKERLYLRNQYQILAEVHHHERDYYLRMVKVLENGYEREYSDITFSFSDGLSESECGFVLDVLSMYTDLERAKERNIPFPPEKLFLVDFHGFDGNNEGKYMSYARFLVEQPGYWDLLKGKQFNSHMPMLGRYHAMLDAWKQSANSSELTADDIIRIMNAA